MFASLALRVSVFCGGFIAGDDRKDRSKNYSHDWLIRRVCVSLKFDAARHAVFEYNSVCVPAQRASHKSAQSNALGLGISSIKSPNGADLNRFELVTPKIRDFPGRCPGLT